MTRLGEFSVQVRCTVNRDEIAGEINSVGLHHPRGVPSQKRLWHLEHRLRPPRGRRSQVPQVETTLRVCQMHRDGSFTPHLSACSGIGIICFGRRAGDASGSLEPAHREGVRVGFRARAAILPAPR